MPGTRKTKNKALKALFGLFRWALCRVLLQWPPRPCTSCSQGACSSAGAESFEPSQVCPEHVSRPGLHVAFQSPGIHGNFSKPWFPEVCPSQASFFPGLLVFLLLDLIVILCCTRQQLIHLSLNVFGKCHPGSCLNPGEAPGKPLNRSCRELPYRSECRTTILWE